MTLFRVVFVVLALSTIGGTAYLSHFGIWRESLDLDRSVRAASRGAGGIFNSGRIK